MLNHLKKKNMYFLSLNTISLILVFLGCGGGGGSDPVAPDIIPTGTQCSQSWSAEQCMSIQVTDTSERYFVFLEPNNRMDTAPVVFFLHGGGLNPDTISNFTDAVGFSNNSGFLAVLPLGGGFWGWSSEVSATAEISEDSAFISAIIDQLVAENQADPNRVYAIGYSGGSHMAYQLACEVSDKIAGIIALSGQIRGDISACNAAFPVAIHHIHGSNDTDTPIAGNNQIASVDETLAFWRELNSCQDSSTESAGFSLTVGNNLATTQTYDDCVRPVNYTLVNNGDHNQNYRRDVLHTLMEELFQ